MMAELIAYDADGLQMKGTLYAGVGIGRRPAILVFPEASGLGDHAKGRAQRLAELGYTAFACDLHGNATFHSDFNTMVALLGPLRTDTARMRERARGALDALRTHSRVDSARIAAIGYCFGGTMALELARGGADLKGVVGFHSGLATPATQDARNIKGKVLVCIGADDSAVPLEQRIAFEKEMREGVVDWQMSLYGGVIHSFTNPEADAMGRPHLRYDAKADARSWAEMCRFLKEVFSED
jgi:dienelactone hydrolase